MIYDRNPSTGQKKLRNMSKFSEERIILTRELPSLGYNMPRLKIYSPLPTRFYQRNRKKACSGSFKLSPAQTMLETIKRKNDERKEFLSFTIKVSKVKNLSIIK